ncbi:MAG: hypothetical protein JWM79_660 [Nocardioides sp.]|nr:hypothetical protein [Nocardioides sp.]
MIPVSAPPRVHHQLQAAPDGAVRVVHRGRHAVYVELGGRCVGVVAATATAVPCALRVTALELPFAGEVADVRAGVLHVDGVALVCGRFVDVAVPHLSAQLLGKGPLLAESRSLSQQLREYVHPRLDPAAVAELVGSGDGLTPYFDDVLCGWLAVHRAAGAATPDVDLAVRAHLGRTTLLSATLLQCAIDGEVLPEFAARVAAIGTTEEPGCAAALAAVGHTSGAGLLDGGRRALVDLFARTAAA